MKSVLYLGAAIALLRSAAALLSDHDDQDPLMVQHGVTNKAAELSNTTTKYLEIQAVAQVADAPLDTEALHSTSDAGSYTHHVGSPTSKWAITYIPYTTSLTCKPASEIRTDIAAIAASGFTTLRLYSTDCSALLHIGSAARTHNLRLILGIHIDSDPTLTLATSQLSTIITWATAPPTSWSLISMIVIGNDAIFNSHLTPATLSTYLTTSRTHLRTHGYPGPITTTEPISVLAAHASLLCPAIDVAAATIHPFFHADISADLAGAYVSEQLAQLERICPGLEGVNLETGWPRRGRRNGAAVPGELEQRVAVEGILGACQGRCVLLGWGDDGWKDEGEFGVEGSWGCGGLFGGGEAAERVSGGEGEVI